MVDFGTWSGVPCREVYSIQCPFLGESIILEVLLHYTSCYDWLENAVDGGKADYMDSVVEVWAGKDAVSNLCVINILCKVCS